MKRAFLIVATLFFTCSAFCQKSVVATGGSATSLSGTKISYSVGQVAMGTAQTTNFSMNEGVQQPIAVSELSIEEALRLAVELNVYPNPSNNTLNIARTDEVMSKLDYQLITSEGVVVLSGVLVGQTTAVSLQNLPAAVYLLRVTDGEQQRAYRIIKK